VLYLHIPFCARKCSYCAFYSRVSSADRQPYVDALCEEIRQRANELWDSHHHIQTVYFGGGTPTLLSIEQLGQITEQLHRSFNLSEVAECTIEANPENLTPQYLSSLRQLNFFNRISIGVQSFDDSDLHILNRRHNGEQAREAIRQARNMGFRNISIDLIYGIPGQSEATWNSNLAECAKLDVQHLSCYALTVESGTMLEHQIQSGRVSMPSDDEVVSRYKSLLHWCRNNNFSQYEISNFCREPYRSRHNRRYWNRTPYMGFGAAAHSFDGKHRRWNIADSEQYIASVTNRQPYFETETLSDKDAFNEYIMTALRTTEGINKSLIDSHFAKHLEHNIQKFISARQIEESDNWYRPTEEGLLHADGIAAELFVD